MKTNALEKTLNIACANYDREIGAHQDKIPHLHSVDNVLIVPTHGNIATHFFVSCKPLNLSKE